VEPFSIENETEADDYLNDLFKRKEYKKMDEVIARARKYIKDDKLRTYFINKATKMLNNG
jgi:hypothetical protein